MENQKQKQDEESKSSGMELLENVIKSNENNIASNVESKESNAELAGDMEDLLLAIGQVQLDLEIVKEFPDESLAFYEKEQLARNQFLGSIPTQIETAISKETKDYLDSFKKDIKWGKKFIWSGLGIFILGIFTFILSIIFATNWLIIFILLNRTVFGGAYSIKFLHIILYFSHINNMKK